MVLAALESVIYMQGEERNYLSFLEAPEHVYVDGDWETPRIVGTGLEDYKPEGQGAPIPATRDRLCWYRIRNTVHQSIP